jgi:endonuclease/exonuclease/phosphatase family metal-dependent hydrolase
VTDELAAGKQSSIRRAVHWLGRQLFPLWVIVWLNGLFLRLTVRDSVELLAPLYYATPWPVLAVLTLPFAFVVWQNPKMVFGVLIVAHLFAGAWILESWRSNEPMQGVADLKIVHWNVNRPIRRLEGTVERIRQFDADVIAIAEPMPVERYGVPSRSAELKERWRRQLADHQSIFADGNLLLVVRGEIKSELHGKLAEDSFYSLYELAVKGREFRLLQVDIDGRPAKPRRAPAAELVSLADSLRDLPLIIAGDFNTPRDSVFLKPLRAHHQNAWESAGSRGADTWPWPFPVLSLDQIWSNSLLKPLRCQTAGNWRSDHLWVEAEFVFGEHVVR